MNHDLERKCCQAKTNIICSFVFVAVLMICSALKSSSFLFSETFCERARYGFAKTFAKNFAKPGGVAPLHVRADTEQRSCQRGRLFSTVAGADAQKYGKSSTTKGKILVLGGTGFLGSEIVKRAVMEGYGVTSISRRGNVDVDNKSKSKASSAQPSTRNEPLGRIEYVKGDARDEKLIKKILDASDEPYVACIHALGLLLDGQSGLGQYNRLASGSGSVPDDNSCYDDITRKTAFYAIEAAQQYATQQKQTAFPFVFISAAEAGWPDMPGGTIIENNLAPDWLRRYLVAKRAVEGKLMDSFGPLRPIIFRPSLIFSYDRLASLPPVGAFFLGNTIGLPFVDKPVTVQALSAAVMQSIHDKTVSGVQRYKDIEEMSGK